MSPNDFRRVLDLTRHGQPIAALVPLSSYRAAPVQQSLIPLEGSGRGLWGVNSKRARAGHRCRLLDCVSDPFIGTKDDPHHPESAFDACSCSTARRAAPPRTLSARKQCPDREVHRVAEQRLEPVWVLPLLQRRCISFEAIQAESRFVPVGMRAAILPGNREPRGPRRRAPFFQQNLSRRASMN